MYRGCSQPVGRVTLLSNVQRRENGELPLEFRGGVLCPDVSKVRVLPGLKHKQVRDRGAGCSRVVPSTLVPVGDCESLCDLHHHLASGFRGVADLEEGTHTFLLRMGKANQCLVEAVSFMFLLQPPGFSPSKQVLPLRP